MIAERELQNIASLKPGNPQLRDAQADRTTNTYLLLARVKSGGVLPSAMCGACLDGGKPRLKLQAVNNYPLHTPTLT